jgi:hypothetical protein
MHLLSLTAKETLVFNALKKGPTTPLALSRDIRISRPTLYTVLKKLHERGLAVSRIVRGRKHWEIANEQKIEAVLYETKRALLDTPLGSEEIRGASDSSVIVYRGREAIRSMFFKMFMTHSHENFSGVQGNTSAIGWDKTFSVADTNKINRQIKEHGLVVKAILPEGWFEEQSRLLGIDWAKDFEGRATRVNVINPRYFNNGGQVWIFKNSLFLMALNEELVIEVRNSEIQKCLSEIFQFVHDTAPVIDANALLRTLIAEGEKQSQPNA